MSSRAVHPAYVPIFPATGVELSCWAYIGTPRPTKHNHNSNSNHKPQKKERNYPNLITAQGSSIRIYEYAPPPPSNDTTNPTQTQNNNHDGKMDQNTDDNNDPRMEQGSLFLLKSFQVSGMVCTLDSLPNARTFTPNSFITYFYDGLLIGFAGNPRLAIVYPKLHGHPITTIKSPSSFSNSNIIKSKPYNHSSQMEILRPSSIIDLTPALWDRCKGASSPMDQDIDVSVCYERQTNDSHHSTTTNNYNNQSHDQPFNLDEEWWDNGKPSIAAIVLGGGVCLAAFSFLRGSIPNDEHDDEDDDNNNNNIHEDENETNHHDNHDSEMKMVMDNHHTNNAFNASSNNITTTTTTTTTNTLTDKTNVNQSPSQQKQQQKQYHNHHQDWWLYASEPYLIDLYSLAQFRKTFTSHSFSSSSNTSSVKATTGRDKSKESDLNSDSASFCSTWGEILSLTFLQNYSSPTLAILHTSNACHRSGATTNSNERHTNQSNSNLNTNNNTNNATSATNGVWAGRMTKTSAYKHACTVTAISLSVEQSRSVVLWSSPDGTCPCDARFLKSIPSPMGGCCVVSPNGILFLPHGGGNGAGDTTTNVIGTATSTTRAGTIDSMTNANHITVLACNGFAHATIAAVKHPNPKPLPLLNIHLDGCRIEFVTANVALLINRDGRVYSIELHATTSTINAKTKTSATATSHPNSMGANNGGQIVLSCAPLPYRMEQGACSCLSVLPLWRWNGGNTKSMESLLNLYNKDDLKSSKSASIGTQGIGLIFCGSRFGDSVLLAYHYEDVRLGLNLDLNTPPLLPTTTTSSSMLPMKRKSIKDEENTNTENDDEMKRSDPVRHKIKHRSHDGPQPPQILSSSDIDIQPTHTTERKEEQNPPDESANETNTNDNNDEEEDEIDEETRLLQEEIELYEGYTTTESPYPPTDSDSDDDSYDINALLAKAHSNAQKGASLTSSTNNGQNKKSPSYYRPTIHNLTVFSTLTSIHTLYAPGPLGPSCRAPSYFPGEDITMFPCGYGPSGGVLIMHPVVDGRNIKNEVDIRGVNSGWAFERLGFILFGVNGLDGRRGLLMKWDSNLGVRENNLEDDGDTAQNTDKEDFLQEVNVDEWCDNNDSMETDNDTPQKLLKFTHILASKEWVVASIPFAILVVEKGCSDRTYEIILMNQKEDNENKDELQIIYSHQLNSIDPTENIMSITTLEEYDDTIFFGCIWSNGQATVVTIDHMNHSGAYWEVRESTLPNSNSDDDKITAIDIFSVFCHDDFSTIGTQCDAAEKKTDVIMSTEGEKPDTIMSNCAGVLKSSNIDEMNTQDEELLDEESFDADDLELYGLSAIGSSLSIQNPTEVNSTIQGCISKSLKRVLRVAVCRASNIFQIYESTLGEPIWQVSGCGHALQKLSTTFTSMPIPETDVRVIEVRVFYCGKKKIKATSFDVQKLCCAFLTDKNDLHIYQVSPPSLFEESSTSLYRISIGNIITRPSLEEKRYRTKLQRKGMLPNAKNVTDTTEVFKENQLHRFYNISGNCGLFASISRPLWILKCDGFVVGLYHKLRHAAPAGWSDVPISAFVEMGSAIDNDKSNKCQDSFKHEGFVTVYERIGRVGSQRMTFYDGLFQLPSQKNNTFYPDGSGMLLTKIPLGVTVRQVAFLDNSFHSTTENPLYLILISHELELDQSFLNDDGLTPEERQQIKEARESEKTRRQVEADLGGFDVEQEWVEEIEREDIFEVDTELGGAPKIHVEKHEIWLVCGGEEWDIVDKYELNDFEHGITLKVMNLTDVVEEGPTGSNSATPSGSADVELEAPLFVAVGTGIVDKDGEDIGSKGRVLLLEIKRKENIANNRKENLRISLTYDKDILLGPVTSLGCLACEGKSRIVIGAGAEVTVEQWGEHKLTQVGFFHANMQVQDIVLFKTFFLLSDAYDSLHFLVWRESDKSLTLLAKDYEPTPVYAAGVLSQGGSMSFICHDEKQNFQYFQYAPKDEAARGGNKLVCRADFHVGMQTISLQNHWCQSSLLVSSSTISSTLNAMRRQDPLLGQGDEYQRFGVHFGTTDGALSSVAPVSERIYWRLVALQSVMSNALESNCALSHRAWRLYRRSSRRDGCRSNDRKKGVLDGVLLFQFINLGMVQQEQLASAIGSTVDVILDNLLELSCACRI